MKSIREFEGIFIHRAPVDLRKNINGLASIVEAEMKLDLKASSIFVFTNRRRTHMKILYFDRSGFAIWFKRLEESKFPWPQILDEDTIELLAADFELMLDGVNVWTRFESVHFNRFF